MRILRSLTVAGLLAALLAVPAAAHAEAPEAVDVDLPAPSGPYRVGSTELHLIDRDRPDPWVPDRQRELMVSVFYPAAYGPPERYPRTPWMLPGAAAHFDETVSPTLGIQPGAVDWAGARTHARTGAPALGGFGGRPVVLYSPGFGVPRTAGTLLVEELASRGYVVVTVDHTYEASEVEFPGGRVEVARVPDPTPDVLKPAMRTRVQDTQFVLDELARLAAGANPDVDGRELPAGLSGALDLSRVGMFGHSAGGFTAAQGMYDDRRIDAGIDLDGTLAYDQTGQGDLSPVAKHGLDRPFLLMGGQGPDGTPTTHRTHAPWKSFWEHSTGWRLDLNVPDGAHFTFTDFQAILPDLDAELDLPDAVLRQLIGTVHPERIMTSQRAYLPAFFDEHLRGWPQWLLDGPVPWHPDVRFIG